MSKIYKIYPKMWELPQKSYSQPYLGNYLQNPTTGPLTYWATCAQVPQEFPFGAKMTEWSANIIFMYLDLVLFIQAP